MPDLTKWIETLDEMREYLVTQASQSNNIIEAVLEREDEVSKEEPILEESELEQLQSLLKSTHWPEAVPGDLICDQASDADKIERAEGILGMMVPTLKGKSFLDFGCGEGHVAVEATKRTDESVVGFDITPQGDLWDNSQILTTDFAKVVEQGPYDVILIYDVIDHMECEAQKVTEQLKEILAPKGKIYLRAHSWCSRHGAHLYHQINKAFVHLVFTRDELEQMGYDLELYPTRKVIYPVATYRQMFSDFEIENISQNKQPVEEFFAKNMMVRNRIQKSWESGKFPQYQMEQSFVDMVLSIPEAEEEAPTESKIIEKQPPNNEEQGDFEQLSELLESNEWPLAAPIELICDENSEEEKVERAKNILNWMGKLNEPLLDFGCGEGHVVQESDMKAVGYDIRPTTISNCHSDFDKVVKEGPYKTILMYDVLDHIEGETPQEALAKAKSVLHDEGTIILRTHPWSSRHATHSYRDKNKAFIHLIFTEEELKKLGVSCKPCAPVFYPIAQYRTWFKEVGLKEKGEPIIERSPVESFFAENQLIRKRIENVWRDQLVPEGASRSAFPDFQMGLSAIEFHLTK